MRRHLSFIAFAIVTAHSLSICAARSHAEDKRSLLNEDAIHSAANLPGLSGLPKRQLESLSRSLKDSENAKRNPHVKLPEPNDIKHEKEKQIRAAARGYELKTEKESSGKRQQEQASKKPQPHLTSPEEVIKSVFDSLGSKSRSSQSDRPTSQKVQAFQEPGDRETVHPKHRTRAGKRSAHPYIVDGKPKELDDLATDHVVVTHSFSGEVGSVKLRAHGSKFVFNIERSKNVLEDLQLVLRGADDMDAIEDGLKNLDIFVDRKTGSSFLVENTASGSKVVGGRFRRGAHDYHMGLSAEFEGRHAVKRSAIRKLETGTNLDRVLRSVETSQSVRRKRELRDDDSVIAHIEVRAMLDLSIWEYHYSAGDGTEASGLADTILYFSHMFNLINLRYANIQNPQLVITVALVSLDIAMTDSENSVFADNFIPSGEGIYGEYLLDDLATIVKYEQLDANGHYLYDHLMAFTYMDLYDSSDSSGLLGIAWLSGVCDHEDGYASSLVQASPQDLEQSVNVAAHELGHNLGSEHDNSDECQPDAGWIMGAYVSYPNSLFFYFSCCSQRQFWSTLAAGKECIDVTVASPGFYNVSQKAGQLYDPDYLCQVAFSTNAADSSYYDDNGLNICEGLICVDPDDSSGWVDSEFIPAQGTDCGTDMWCIETQCVDKSENETSLYQGPNTCDLSNLPKQGDCAYYELECHTGVTYFGSECYNSEQYCDGSVDCEDASDESYCRCEDGTFSCGTDDVGIVQCYHAELFCDGIEDCSNGTDEVGCDMDCPSGYLQCEEGPATSLHVAGQHNCYPDTGRCDISYDCYDLSDERDCDCDSNRTCEAYEFGRNISICWRDEMTCDGDLHCNVNYEDEQDCPCNPGEVRCPNDFYCIPEMYLCDGYDDCSDRSDEFNCTTCSYGMEKCPDDSYCIYSDWYCDAQPDCADSSDEDCTCQMYGMFDCEHLASTTTMSYYYDNTPCIDGYRVCNNITDCADGKDEDMCDQPCPYGYSKCASGSASSVFWNETNWGMNPTCYPDASKCDHSIDCYDYSDEYNCTCEDYGDLTCNASGQCIPQYYVCDGYNDCWDGEDEYDCPCMFNEFECLTHNSSSNKCLSLFAVCDGYYDCLDGSDEGDICVCEADEFTCTNGSSLFPPFGACIASNKYCDSRMNCIDLSDEENCALEDVCPPSSVLRCLTFPDYSYSYESTTQYYYTSTGDYYYDNYDYDWASILPSYQCLDNSSICDGLYECITGDDELDCPCPNSDDYRCYDGTCIPMRHRCDYNYDCMYGEDEVDCVCMSDQFHCPNSSECIPSGYVCDSEEDCYFGEDEDSQICDIDCDDNQFRCADGVSRYTGSPCIWETWLCDGEADCTDHSDENASICMDLCSSGSVWCQLDDYDYNSYEYRNYACIDTTSACNGWGYAQCLYHEDMHNCSSSCGSTDFHCYDGECIPGSWECDDIIDCTGGEDEWCGLVCYDDDKLPCPGEDTCIDWDWFCDGYIDCYYGGDEAFCNETCSENEFKCEISVPFYSSNTTCISNYWLCDGFADCLDGSDEAQCDDMCKAESGRNDSIYCLSTQYTNEYMCVHNYSSFVCDGIADCMNREDEDLYDCGYTICSYDEYMCPDMTCIPQHWVCDGYNDCEEFFGIFYDEYFCNNTFCAEDEAECNGTCFNAFQICDGVQDCQDGRDEYQCDSDCPDGLQSCETGASNNALYYLQLNNWPLSDPPHCYNSTDLWGSLECLISQCVDQSDVEDCTCEDVSDTYASLNATVDFGEDALLCPITVFSMSFLSCFDRNHSIMCNGQRDCSNGIDESLCEDGTTQPEYETTQWEWLRPTAWDSDRLYPFGDEAGDSDVMEDLHDWESYWLCKDLSLNGRIGAQYYNQRYYTVYICNNGMLTFNSPWREHYPSVFETSSYYDELDILAPFWGLIDEVTMSLITDIAPDARTRVFYHTYEDGDDIDLDTQAILDRATEDVADSTYAIENFTATWVLVVTWVNQKPEEGCSYDAYYYLMDWGTYPDSCRQEALNERHFNHFQAVLITDGIYTFVKYNYPEDGINWLLPSLHSDLDEQSFSEAVENANHMSNLPIAAFKNSTGGYYLLSSYQRLQIDELPGNMADGRAGEYLFRLEHSSGAASAELECTNWVYEETDVADMYTNYSIDMAPCPPSLFIAWQDPSFQWASNLGSNVVCYATRADEDGYPGLRQMCCYDDDWWSDSWSALFVGPPHGGYPINIDDLDHELHGRLACCVEASGMCSMFHTVRVSSNGETYISPSIWPVFGDPHITTSDGLTYTFNGLGEYLFTSIDNGKTIIQARTERVVLDDGSPGQATYFSAVCVNTDGLPWVQIQSNKNNEMPGVENELQLIIDGEVKDISLIELGTNVSQAMNGVDTEIQFQRTNASLTVSFTTGLSLTIASSKKMLTITQALPSKFMGKTIGLTGVYDNNKENDFTSLDGSSISIDSSESEIFDWASGFAISEQDSLMYYSANTNWYTYNDNSFVPVFIDDIDNWVWSTDDLKTAAYDLCKNDTSCLYDVYITGDLSVGENSKQVSEDSKATNAILINFPPTIRGDDALLIVIGQPFEYVVTVNDTNGDSITVTTNIPSTVVMNGNIATITATVTDTTEFVFRVTAKDPSGAASAKTPLAMLCNCFNGGTCIHLTEEQQSIIESPSVVLDCICPTGYTGSLCDTDLDACQLVASPCYPSVPCVDLPAPADHTGYTCGDCPSGYTGDGKTCTDIDECTGDVCGHLCINSPGSFVCACRTGYSLNTDGSTCDDIDECALDPCHHGCENTDGSFTCTCNSGFVLMSDELNCEPANPCEDPNPCDATNGYCNTVGDGKECSCKKGYTLNADESTCDEVDECRLGTHFCAQICTNTVGGYTCSCEPGYSLGSNGMDCTDVNECVTGNYTCHLTQMCSNNVGGYDCVCSSGQVFKDGKCQTQVFADPVEPVTTVPDPAAEFNSVKFSLQGMAMSEYTLLKEINLFTLLAEGATASCARTSCEYVAVASEAKRRRKRSTGSVTFYKEYFSRLPGYPEENNGDVDLAIYALVQGSGVLPGEVLKQVVQDASASISIQLGANVINLETLYTEAPVITDPTEVVTAQPPSLLTVYIAVGVGLGIIIIALIIAVVILKLKKGNESTKTVYPISDPEFSRKSSRTESVGGGMPKKELGTAIEIQYETVAVASEPPPAHVEAKPVHSNPPSRPLSGKNVQDHTSRVQTPTHDSFAPVDTEGAPRRIEKELTCKSIVVSDFYTSKQPSFDIPYLALPQADKDSQKTRICLIPPTPQPHQVDPYANYHLT